MILHLLLGDFCGAFILFYFTLNLTMDLIEAIGSLKYQFSVGMFFMYRYKQPVLEGIQVDGGLVGHLHLNEVGMHLLLSNIVTFSFSPQV